MHRVVCIESSELLKLKMWNVNPHFILTTVATAPMCRLLNNTHWFSAIEPRWHIYNNTDYQATVVERDFSLPDKLDVFEIIILIFRSIQTYLYTLFVV